jgi:hypothetical protein
VRKHVARPDADGIVISHVDGGEMMERSVLGAEFVDDVLRSRATGYAMTSSEVEFSQCPSAAPGDSGDDDVAAVFFHQWL